MPKPLEWVVTFTLPSMVGNLYYMREHLKGRLIQPQLGGATVISGYVEATTALEAAEMFGRECTEALGSPLMSRVERLLAVRALP